MSIEYNEAREQEAYDRLVEELYEEHKEQAIDEFVSERLRSYYLKHPDVAVPPLRMFQEATDLEQTSPAAALTFFVSATELAIKSALLKPVVFGLVHSEPLAVLVADLATRQTGIDRFRALLFKVLAEYGGIDLGAFRIENHSKKLWEELGETQRVRNEILHRGELPSAGATKLAKEISTMIISTFLATVVDSLELRLVQGGHILPIR